MAPRSAIVVALFLLCEGILFFVYCLHPAWNENIKFGAAVVGAAFALFEFLQKSQHDRSESAGEFIKRWNDPILDTLRKEIRSILIDALLLEPLIQKSENHVFTQDQKDKRSQLIGVLNFFEELALSIHKKRADERYLYDFFSVTVKLVWTKLKPWIDEDRRFGDPSYWDEFEDLANRWEKAPPWWI